jgi:hypothetical protein
MPRHVTEIAEKWRDPHPEGIAKNYVPPGKYTRAEILDIVRTAWARMPASVGWDLLDSERKCTYFDLAVTLCNQPVGNTADQMEREIIAALQEHIAKGTP